MTTWTIVSGPLEPAEDNAVAAAVEQAQAAARAAADAAAAATAASTAAVSAASAAAGSAGQAAASAAGAGDATMIRRLIGLTVNSQVAASGNAMLINAALAGGGHLGISEAGTVYVNTSLVVPSNTHLHLGPGTTLKLADGSNTYLIRNSDHTNGNVNIGLSGGTLDCNMAENTATGIWPTAWNGSAVCLVNVDCVKIKGQRGLNAPKFMYQIAGCENVWVEDLTFDTGSDGVHVNGPARHVFIRNISGTCGDDMVAFTGSDYPSILTIPGGDIYDVSVENVHGVDTEKALVKLLAGGNGALKLHRATIRGVKGKSIGSSAVIVDEDNLAVGTTGRDLQGIEIRDVNASVPPGYGVIHVGGVGETVIKVEGLHIAHSGQVVDGIKVTGGTIKSLLVKGLTCDAEFKGNALVNNGTITHLQMGGVSSGFLNGSGRVLYTTGAITKAHIGTVSTTGGGLGVITTSATGAITDLYLTGVDVRSAYYIVEHGGSSEMKVHLSAVTQDAIQVAGFRASGTGGLTINGAGFKRQGNLAPCLLRTAAQAMKVNCPSFPVDVSILTKTKGDFAYNDNAALSCGDGVVLSDGTNWKSLYSGATS